MIRSYFHQIFNHMSREQANTSEYFHQWKVDDEWRSFVQGNEVLECVLRLWYSAESSDECSPQYNQSSAENGSLGERITQNPLCKQSVEYKANGAYGSQYHYR